MASEADEARARIAALERELEALREALATTRRELEAERVMAHLQREQAAALADAKRQTEAYAAQAALESCRAEISMLRAVVAHARFTRSVQWELTGDALVPWRAEVGAESWQVRVNEFPEEPHLYTLLVDSREAGDFDTWPASWAHAWPPGATSASPPVTPVPKQSGDDPHEKAEYDREMAWLRRQRSR